MALGPIKVQTFVWKMPETLCVKSKEGLEVLKLNREILLSGKRKF